MKSSNFIVVAHNNLGDSLSGGDQIFLNFIKYRPSNIKVTLIASQESVHLSKKYQADPDKIIVSAPKNNIKTLSTSNLFFHQIIRLFYLFKFCFTHRRVFLNHQYIYTSSDFPSDTLFGFIAKLINPKIKWVSGFYLFAPRPGNPESPYVKQNRPVRGLIYFFGQYPFYILTKYFADFVFVTSEPDVIRFNIPRLINRIFVIRGGVYLPDITKFKKSRSYIPPSQRTYDALFLGRLHVQKGIIELMDIWRLVVDRLPKAKLAIIGDGELKDELIQKISKLKLTKNVVLHGFAVGDRKYHIINDSKLILHPAVYDSGGMAAAEAMAWGLPGVSFDLEALKTYYPYGMIKTPCFDFQKFADNIIDLLSSPSKYQSLSRKAITLTIREWGWQNRIPALFNRLLDSK